MKSQRLDVVEVNILVLTALMSVTQKSIAVRKANEVQVPVARAPTIACGTSSSG